MIKMLIESSSKGSSYQAKQESSDNNKAAPSTITSSSSRSQWTAFRNPRIVRVSRTMGGKDRHSKVCTIRGLRDRRIRLSVPTAIQLYDLQERLGLSQPSKVIDWLIEATKLDIDKLPPLHFPQGCFPPHQFHHHHPRHELPMMSGGVGVGAGFYDGGSYQSLLAKGKWIKTSTNNQQENSSYDDQDQRTIGDSSSAQKLFPIVSSSTNNSNNSSSLSGLLNNAMAYNNSYNSDQHSSLSLSQFGGSHGLLFPSQLLDPNHPGSSGNGVQFSSSNLPLATPSPSIFSPYYAPFMVNSSMESSGDPRQFNNHVQLLSSSSQVMPLIPSSMMNSPLRRVPTPFSSKLLDSDHHSNRSSQADDKE